MNLLVMAANAYTLTRPYTPNRPAMAGKRSPQYQEEHRLPHNIIPDQAT